MGRQLKRVPLDFNWPINMKWKGFICPYRSQECKPCGRTGLNPETKKIDDEWYNFDNVEWIYLDAERTRRYNNLAWKYHLTEIEVEALVREGRLSDVMNNWYTFDEKKNHWKYIDKSLSMGDKKRKWRKCERPEMPTPEIVNKWALTGFGHDAVNKWICVEARAKHLGVYGKCEHCNGTGEIWQSQQIKKLHDKWEPEEPPTGEGYQMWENTTEGSPQSPVFKTLDELCAWLEDNATTFGYCKTSKEEWKKMLDDGHVHHQEGNFIFI